MSRINRAPLSLTRIARYAKGHEGKTIVVVGTVTDDSRVTSLPALTVTALRFTAGARQHILSNGGEVLTFDQLALRAPTGKNTLLLRGPRNGRTATKYFGAAGLPGSKTRPRIESKGRKFQSARGRRNGVGYRN